LADILRDLETRMIFTVVWTPAAEQRLAAVWLSAADRMAVTRSAIRLAELLRVDPQQQGDLRFDTVRSIIVGALGVEFEVVEEDRLVRILSVRDAMIGKPGPPKNGSSLHG
jgi:hypothetical protein